MNRYGARAMSHWQTYNPEKYRAIEDPETFFAALGELAETQIQSLATGLAGSDPPNETTLEKLGRLRMAHLQAEEQILAELILIPSALPEDQHQDEAEVPDVVTVTLESHRREAAARASEWQQEIDQELQSQDPWPPAV